MGVLKRFSYDNIVIHDPTAPDPVDYDSGGEGGGEGGEGGEGGCDCVKDSYIVFLSNDGILKYRDGETDVALLPSDIPADTGLIFIVLVYADPDDPLYHYYWLKSVEMSYPPLAVSKLYFTDSSDTVYFEYDAEAGGFVMPDDGGEG